MITILTPTFNRAHLLPRLFESLTHQTDFNFEWLVMDDGSTDGTSDLFAGKTFLSAPFPIRYYQQENGGKHRALNAGVKQAKGDFIFIADSDDWLLPQSVAIVGLHTSAIADDNTFAGVAGLDVFDDERIVGTGLPQDIIDCNAMDIRYRYHVDGDLKEVFKTTILQEFPFPEIQDEKFCPEQLVWFRIAQKYKLRYFNTPIYVAEYQPNGITASIIRVRMLAPQATCMMYAEMLAYKIPFKEKIKAAINFWRFKSCAPSRVMITALKGGWRWCYLMGMLLHWRDKRQVGVASLLK
ncbi:Glycosyl transferase family 2 [Segatella oulorum]|uniref:Glycosyl transferase family 2 n=1 Tax=Segatella oulorum TaxID=28136 RepID=A0A1T4P7N1_9BACT|nr:glycosyltransferase family A protein [Segatella oulorum]SJZ87469.1 Glycosyl transferase family 2 [Segatella oulorum]